MNNKISNYFKFFRIYGQVSAMSYSFKVFLDRLDNKISKSSNYSDLLDYVQYLIDNDYVYSVMIDFGEKNFDVNKEYLNAFLRIFKQSPEAALIIKMTDVGIDEDIIDFTTLVPIIEKYIGKNYISARKLIELKEGYGYVEYSKDFFNEVDENDLATYGFERVYKIYHCNQNLDVLKAINSIPSITNKTKFLIELLGSTRISALSDYIVKNQDNFDMNEYNMCCYYHQCVSYVCDVGHYNINRLIGVIEPETLERLLPIFDKFYFNSYLSPLEFNDKISTLLFDIDFEDKKDKLIDILNTACSNKSADLFFVIIKHLEDLRYVNVMWLDEAIKMLVEYDEDFEDMSLKDVQQLIRK